MEGRALCPPLFIGAPNSCGLERFRKGMQDYSYTPVIGVRIIYFKPRPHIFLAPVRPRHLPLHLFHFLILPAVLLVLMERADELAFVVVGMVARANGLLRHS